MKIGDYEFDGTVEELLSLKRELDKGGLDGHVGSVASLPPAGDDDPDFVNENAAYLILVRRKLSAEQRQLLTILYNAGTAWTPASELQKKLDYSTSEFAGMMGAFGRRVTHTRGVGLYEKFFDQRWDDQRACNLYRLPPSVRAAFERAKVV